MGERGGWRLPGDRVLARLDIVWAAIFYLSLALGAVAALVESSWRMAPLPAAGGAALLACSAALFQRLYWPGVREPRCWPMPARPALWYFGGQLLVLAGLLQVSPSFIGLGFALMGQATGGLRPRRWALVLVPLLALMARPLGVFDTDVDWLGLAWLGLSIAIWLFLAGLLYLLFTQRHRLIQLVGELHEAREQLEAAAAQQEELAVLRERTRLAREMHDSIGHALVSVNVKLEAAQRLYRVDPPRADAELEGTRALVRETMGELRRSIADLRAPLPDHRDLPAALARLADEVGARGRLSVTVDAEPGCAPPPPVAESLFLIAREALANVERHAGAARAAVRLGREGAAWRLEVLDDGVGVRAADLRRAGHFGVVGMRERAAALGGSLLVSPRPEGGTRVAAAIPDAAGGAA